MTVFVVSSVGSSVHSFLVVVVVVVIVVVSISTAVFVLGRRLLRAWVSSSCLAVFFVVLGRSLRAWSYSSCLNDFVTASFRR